METEKIFNDLESERLLLRKLTASDVDFIYSHFSDENVCRYLYDEEPVSSHDEAIELINFFIKPVSPNFHRWILTTKDTNTKIGTCGYHCWDKKNNIAEIGYDLSINAWGKGYMREALGVIVTHGFEVMNLNRVQAYVAVDNKASINLLERLGFAKEGIVRDKHLFRGKYYDHYCFSLLKSEWN